MLEAWNDWKALPEGDKSFVAWMVFAVVILPAIAMGLLVAAGM